MKLVRGLAQGLQAARLFTVKIELIARVQANARVSVPEHDAVKAAELISCVSQKRGHMISSRADIAEQLIVQHNETAGKIACGP
jgi:hypothetical protein